MDFQTPSGIRTTGGSAHKTFDPVRVLHGHADLWQVAGPIETHSPFFGPHELKTRLSISVVSHGQSSLVTNLFDDIRQCCYSTNLEVVLTLNVPEVLPFQLTDFPFPITVIRNLRPKGFGENHNAAFNVSHGNIFCVLNPDIRLASNPFEALISCLEDVSVGVAAPMVVASDGSTEDSARRFPTPWKILLKVLGCRSRVPEYSLGGTAIYPDWVGGMFMLFRRETFKAIGGFDERYFLYYEDVDLCARLGLAGYQVLFSPQAVVVHDARRTSHRSLKYLKWHVSSMARFFLSYPFWATAWRRFVGR
ncbi:MAG: glycosyltransferase [Sideroxydans sp.]|nr:glycosyltransferase [Sideroxydans sp.]